MSDSNLNQGAGHQSQNAPVSTDSQKIRADGARKKSISMHENIGAWCDCCSCEAEPYWLEVAEELGIDLGSDYENPDAGPG